MPNAGQANRRSCGDEPIIGSVSLVATPVNVGGVFGTQLSWGQATDESGGEKDVARYVIWRRPDTIPDWEDPYESVPAGLPSYVFQDLSVDSGTTYVYGLAAQDCTPKLSSMRQSAAVTPWP
jgi:hypothetical protein